MKTLDMMVEKLSYYKMRTHESQIIDKQFNLNIKKVYIFFLFSLVIVSCSSNGYKAYDNYYLGTKIENDSIFKYKWRDDESDPLHHYYRRLEKLPNGSMAKLTFITTYDVLTDIKLFIGRPAYQYPEPFMQIERFKPYCTNQEKEYFLASLRKKYGTESDSLHMQFKGSVDTSFTYSWHFTDYDVSLTYIIKGMPFPDDMKKYYPKEYELYDQNEHNQLWIEYSINSKEKERLESKVQERINKANDKF